MTPLRAFIGVNSYARWRVSEKLERITQVTGTAP